MLTRLLILAVFAFTLYAFSGCGNEPAPPRPLDESDPIGAWGNSGN